MRRGDLDLHSRPAAATGSSTTWSSATATAFGDVHDCTSLGFYDHDPVSCTESCELDTSQCTQSCGNHVLDGPELCDGEPAPGQSCLDFGFGVGRIACATGCGPAFDGCSAVGLALEVAFPSTMQAVMGRDADDVFAVGGAATVAHFDGSGWSSTQVALAGSLTALWVDPASPVAVAVGNDGSGHAVAATTSDGSAWTVTAMPICPGSPACGARARTTCGRSAPTLRGTASPCTTMAFRGAARPALQSIPSTASRWMRPPAASSPWASATQPLLYDGSMWHASTTGCGSDCTTDSGGASYDYEGVAFVPGVGSGSAQLVAVGTSRPGFFALVARSFDGGVTWSWLRRTARSGRSWRRSRARRTACTSSVTTRGDPVRRDGVPPARDRHAVDGARRVARLRHRRPRRAEQRRDRRVAAASVARRRHNPARRGPVEGDRDVARRRDDRRRRTGRLGGYNPVHDRRRALEPGRLPGR